MNFNFEPEQLELVDLLRAASADQAPATRLLDERVAADAGADPAWRLLSKELQVLGVDVPVAHGGLGLSAVELAIVAEEAGRVLAPAGFTASVGLAQSVLLECVSAGGAPDAGSLLARSAEGHRMALGIDVGGEWSPLEMECDDGSSARVTGTLDAVLDSGTAEHLVVLARTGQGQAIAVVDGAAVVHSPIDAFDSTVQLCRAVLHDAPATVLLDERVDAALERVTDRARLVVAAEALGGARHCLEVATAHAEQREQFGRPIGSFQAVKHRLADLLVEVELATSAVYLAACQLTGVGEDTQLSSRMALAAATSAFERAARDAVQVHGGMGFTWEHQAHLYLKRAQLLALLLGSEAEQHANIYTRAGKSAR